MFCAYELPGLADGLYVFFYYLQLPMRICCLSANTCSIVHFGFILSLSQLAANRLSFHA